MQNVENEKYFDAFWVQSKHIKYNLILLIFLKVGEGNMVLCATIPIVLVNLDVELERLLWEEGMTKM